MRRHWRFIVVNERDTPLFTVYYFSPPRFARAHAPRKLPRRGDEVYYWAFRAHQQGVIFIRFQYSLLNFSLRITYYI